MDNGFSVKPTGGNMNLSDSNLSCFASLLAFFVGGHSYCRVLLEEGFITPCVKLRVSLRQHVSRNWRYTASL